jgi:hypothetical protein
MLELYLTNSIKKDVIIYSNIYKPLHPLSVFSIKTDIFENSNGFPNNIDDILLCNKICLERIKNTGSSIEYVSSNNIESNSLFFNINYEDDIADVRPNELKHKLSNEEINKINNIRYKSNYDNWCGIKQKYYFNTFNISYYIDSNGNTTNIIIYKIDLHNSCDIYNEIDSNIIEIKSIDDINKILITFIKNRLNKYLIEEELIDNTILIKYVIDDNLNGINMNYGEYIECILNVIEETFYYINNIKNDNTDIQKVLKLIIKNWYSYINVEPYNDDQKIYTINLTDPSILIIVSVRSLAIL